MDTQMGHLDLLDLISERHLLLRKISENRWNDSSDIYLSNSEWFILTRIYQEKETTISYITKQVDISRQATHKFVKSLKEKGLVDVKKLEHNKKEKGIQLTAFGKECFEKNTALKVELVEKIAETIGEENVHQLKNILKMDWGL